MGRSGTTLLFECLATHPDVGWLAHHANRYPGRPELYALTRLCDWSLSFRKSIERSDQRRSLLEKIRLGPAEAYETWEALCGEKIRNSWLEGVRPSPQEREDVHGLVRAVLRWSAKSRFAAKLTGPPRIGFLQAIFPDAIFVHVVRDGRAVARSLLRVDFWRNSFRLREPAWKDGFPAAYEALWHAHEDSPLALAALQWRHVIEVARREASALAPGQYHELRYEDLLADPERRLDELLRVAALAPSTRVQRFLRSRFQLRDMNEASRRNAHPDEDALLDDLLAPTLRSLGYETAAAAPSPAAPARADTSAS